jgi:hypothetical protein
LENYPRLQELFLPLARCIKSGNLKEFDEALKSGEDEFVKRRIYLTLERGRDIALRNLLRKVFIAGGYDEPKEGDTAPVRRTRIPVTEFQAAISMSSGQMIEGDEVECLLANMIYKVSCSIPWCTRGTGCLLIPALPFFRWKTGKNCLLASPRQSFDYILVTEMLPYFSVCLGHSRSLFTLPSISALQRSESLTGHLCFLGIDERLYR